MPTRGFQFNSEAKYRQSLSDAEYSNISLSTSLATYIPFDASDQVVLAVHLGGAYTFGDYEFFHANYLSNKSRMRGFRLNRFAGDGMVYAASDLRIKVFKGSGAFPTDIGIFGSFDVGRVFLKNENQDQLHSSFGGGIFLQPLNLVSFKAGYHIGQDDKQLIIGGSMAF
jgi:hemolysin activation/secretion protein